MLEFANTSEGRRRSQKPLPDAETEVRRIALVGNFPPRRCGIATFTADTHDALTGDAHIACDVYTVTDEAADYSFPSSVKFVIRDKAAEDYLEAARRINASDAELVLIQHEYGIFGDRAGDNIIKLLEAVTKPIVTTLHTVLAEPNADQRRVMNRIVDYSEKIIVMTRKGRDLLRAVHGVPASKIVIVPHGVPDRPLLETANFKAQFGFAGRDVILTFGLLSPSKGIETTIRALPAVVTTHPNVLYVVLGATHPVLIERDGEAYRESLAALAAELGVAGNIALINEYTDIDRLVDYIGAADIYVSPYLNENQITSGTLSYAVALGKPVISTPYWHACELLAQGRGVLVPFNDPPAISKALETLLDDDAQRETIRQNAYAAGREMIWSRVAVRSARVLAAAMTRAPVVPRAKLTTVLLPPSLLGVEAMTDSCGILQHTVHCVPDRNHGYCLDDNARALILMHRLDANGFGTPASEKLTPIYAAFVQHAWNDPAGRFRNFMSYERRWLEPTGSEDSFGRALWSLGVTLELASSDRLKGWALALFERILCHAPGIHSPRAQAFCIIALCGLLETHPCHPTARALLAQMSDELLERIAGREGTSWPWFDTRLAYDNARLPEALIRAGAALGDHRKRDAGLQALKWLCKVQTSYDGRFQPVGNESFGRDYAAPLPFDQQPIEAAATIDAAVAALAASGDRHWKVEAQRAYDWFLGANSLGEALAFPAEGICLDGLARDGLNRNQGAESVLSFALATCSMHALGRHEHGLESPAFA